MDHFRGLLGIVVLLGLAYAFSTNRRAIRMKTVAWGLGLQFLFALMVIYSDRGQRVMAAIGDKVLIEARWGNGSEEPLPKFARELIALRVAALVAGSVPSARAAKAATTAIPIVFVTGSDPQTEGLVSSISRPGGNMTGVSFYDTPITGKRLALLHELVPKAEVIAVLQDPTSAPYKSEALEIEKSARALG